MDLIATHPQADFDGLASMVGVRRLYPGARLVLAGGAQEMVTRFLRDHDLDVSRLQDIALSSVTRVVLVDTQEPTRLQPLQPLWARGDVVVHVFDHHGDHASDERSAAATASASDGPSSDGPASAALASASPAIERRVIDSVGATTTLVWEELLRNRITLTPFEATVMAIGIYEETGSLTYGSTTPRDVDAVAALLRAGADLGLVGATLRKAVVPEQIALLNDLLQSADTHYLEGQKVLVTSSPAKGYEGDLAPVMTMIMRVEGVDAVLAACTLDQHKVQIIGRSRHPAIDVSWIAREFGGDGHAVAAAATVKDATIIEIRERMTTLLLERYRPTLLAKDVMTRPVKTIGEECSLEEAGRLMTMAGVTVFPVVDGQGRYCGMISRETVQKASFHQLGQTRVAEFTQTDGYTGEPETPFHEVERQMLEGHQRMVPLLVGTKVVGVITRTDLLRRLHDDVSGGALRRPADGSDASTGRAVPPAPPAHQRDVGGIVQERLSSKLVALLRRAGEVGDRRDEQVYLVGGLVRDLLLGYANTDVDLVVEGDGIAFAKALAEEQGGRVTAHERFGTARMTFAEGEKLDVATARTEYYAHPSALPTVEQGSIKRDLSRRDFTINTLAIRLNAPVFGRLLDFYGGERDCKTRTIRVLHSLSFVEDPTRIFRAVRFAVRFGFVLGRHTRALMVGAIRMDLIERLSPHRLADELRLLLSEREPRANLGLLAELGVLRRLHPSLQWSAGLQRLLSHAEDTLAWYRLLYLDRRMEPWLVYLAVLLSTMPLKAVTSLMGRLELPERAARLCRVAKSSGYRLLRRLSSRSNLPPSQIARTLNGLDEELLLYLMAVSKSDQARRRMASYITRDRQTKPFLTGNDLTRLGVSPGPIFTSILTALYEARLDERVVTVEDEERLVRQLMAGA